MCEKTPCAYLPSQHSVWAAGTAPAGLLQDFCGAGAPVLGTRFVFYPVASTHISQACSATLTAADLELSSDFTLRVSP